MAFQISPGVSVSEVDLTTVVPAVSTTAGGYAGRFQWGPAGKKILITNETQLVSVYGKPDGNTATSFFSAANFLAYGNNLQVVRAANNTSYNSVSGGSAVQIANEDTYDVSYTSDSSTVPFIARYPGALGNSLKVSINSANTSLNASATFANWEYKSSFTSAPNTSSYVASAGGAYDQMHVIVIDEDGLFSNGQKGTVLEVFPFLSKASDGVNDDGSPSYYRTVIRNQSRYIYALGPVDYSNTSATWGSTAAGTSFQGNSTGATASLAGGTSKAVQDPDTSAAWDVLANPDTVNVSLLISGDASTTIQQKVIDTAVARKDCVAFVSPPSTVITSATPDTIITTWAGTTIGRATSYAVADSGWKYQFDKYNNVYRYIPLNGDIAGLCVRTDSQRDPWFSPAGYTRGAIKNCIKLSWNPNKANRDTLYAKGVNPVVSFPGQGTILYGDKTLLSKPSAFDRINVRRLFIVLEKAIAQAAQFSLFELNDEFTRAQFVSFVTPFLRDIQGRRGIYDFKVVCDTTNNTQQIIDSNQFVGDIYIKPARSINFIQLNFVAVRTGVSFNEVVGAA